LVSCSFSLSFCPFFFVIVLSVLLLTKWKGQKDKEKLEDTKEVMRSRK
jgi:hypothetical protein